MVVIRVSQYSTDDLSYLIHLPPFFSFLSDYSTETTCPSLPRIFGISDLSGDPVYWVHVIPTTNTTTYASDLENNPIQSNNQPLAPTGSHEVRMRIYLFLLPAGFKGDKQ